MSRFIGSKVAEEHNQTAFRELYEFNVLAPAHPEYDPQAVLPAFVTAEVLKSHIAEELARAFGANSLGDTIELTIQEILYDGSIRRFRFPIVVNFASRNRGPEYIQIGLLDLDAYFEMAIYRDPNDPNGCFLQILLRGDSDRDCLEGFEAFESES